MMIRLSIWRLEFSAIVNNLLQMPKSKLRKKKLKAQKSKKNILRKQAKNRIKNRIQKERILLGMSKAHKLSQIIEEKMSILGFFVI